VQEDILSGQLEAFEGKTTVIGDYPTIKKDDMSPQQNQLAANPFFSHIEIYSNTKANIKRPSKWTTEIYIPFTESCSSKAYTPAVTNRTPSEQASKRS
jgi:hypothetical protein